MTIPPRRKGIQRISEGQETRHSSDRLRDLKLGKTCVGCRKYYNYLKQDQKLCVECSKRQAEYKR